MSVFKSSLLFTSGTFISRLFGLIRESVLAGTYGAGTLLDAFLIANRIPNMLREMLAEGALGSSFTKVFSALSAKDPDKAKKLFAESLCFFALVSTLFCILGIFFAEQLVSSMMLFSGPGKTEVYQQAVGLTQLLFPFIGLMTLSAIVSGTLHQKGRFFYQFGFPHCPESGLYFWGPRPQ